MGFRWRFYSPISHLANTGHSRSLGDHVWKMFDVDINGNIWKFYMFFFWFLLTCTGHFDPGSGGFSCFSMWLATCWWLWVLWWHWGGEVTSKAARLPMRVSRKRLCSPLLWLMMMWLRIHHSKVCHFILPPGQFWWCVAWFPSPFHPEEFSMSFLPFMRLGMHLITCLPFFANLHFSPCGAENFGPWGGYHHEGTAVGTDAMGGLQHH